MNEKCDLCGIDQPETECVKCHRKTVRLQWAVVTTSHKFVLCGLVAKTDIRACPPKVTLYECRQAVLYIAMGSMGLAAKGPSSQCRITGASPEHTANGVTGITVCSPKAVDNWMSEPWSK
jgi:hypothetical protein